MSVDNMQNVAYERILLTGAETADALGDDPSETAPVKAYVTREVNFIAVTVVAPTESSIVNHFTLFGRDAAIEWLIENEQALRAVWTARLVSYRLENARKSI